MNKFKVLTIFTLISLIFLSSYAEEITMEKPKGSIYLEGSKDIALILAHGKGKGPTSKVVDPLRKSINRQLNYHTLSLQMPNKRENFREYEQDFPESYNIIKQAISFLTKVKHVKKVYLLGHSMGSRMASSFLAENKNAKVDGLIIIGCRNGGGTPFSCIDNVTSLTIPILDIWGSYNDKDDNAAAQRSFLISPDYQQVSIDGANHRLDAHEEELSDIVKTWLLKR